MIYCYTQYHLINVRDHEGFSGNKIDKLYVGEKVKIIGYGKAEKIDGDYSYFWTNIEFHNGKTGWIYGKYIANKTLILDMDFNGVDDYIFLRYKNLDFMYSVDYPEDIMVFINGNLMQMPSLGERDFSHVYFYVSKYEDKVLISIENDYDGMPTPDDFNTDWKITVYLILVTEDGIDYVDYATSPDCNLSTPIEPVSSELKPEYIEPYLGRYYTFIE
ncbi:MAG: SH3 domain-containing protein [Spirochaetaceae bacterium]|nr:SH3 domain-containing protein [Spirochaetaceae bacterium]